MKKKFMRGIAAALAVLMMMPTAAFADTTTDGSNSGQQTITTDGNEPPVVPTDSDEAEEFEITCVNNDALKVWTDGGKTIQLKVDGYTDVYWQSEDKSTATISADGTVTGLKEGSVTIHASSMGKTASCTVTVVKRTVDSISVSGTPKKEYIDDTCLLICLIITS